MNPVYTGFLLPSLLWVQQWEPEQYGKIRHVCMPKDYLRFCLTGELATDYSDASATLAFDVKNLDWATQVLDVAGVDQDLFPACFAASDCVGAICKRAAEQTGLAANTRVVAGGGDTVMQGIGCGAVHTGIATSNIGSSGQIGFQSDLPLMSARLATNTFCGYKKKRWITMGAIMHAGLSLKWFNGLFDTTDYQKLDAESAHVPPGSNGLVFLPYLNGERTPHMNSKLSGMFLGCHINTTRADMARAVMEGVTFALYQCMEVCGDMGLSAKSIIASGGGAKSPLWLKIQSDVYGMPVSVAAVAEQAALGAAIAAGVGGGIYGSVEEGCGAAVKYLPGAIEPDPISHHRYTDYYNVFKEAYQANRHLLEKLHSL